MVRRTSTPTPIIIATQPRSPVLAQIPVSVSTTYPMAVAAVNEFNVVNELVVVTLED